jgi:acyl-coenzyme A thioesterase PaaI-like protein
MTATTITPNRLQRQLSRLNEVPAYFRPWFQSVVLGRAVPFTGTAKLRYEVMSPEKVVVFVANRRKVHNHIEGVHAMATTLAAETATGMVMGMNVRDDCLPVVKEMRVQFTKRGMGAMRAVATLTDEQRALIQSTDKGEVTVPVVVTDESGNHPLVCEFIWAWIPSKRPAKKTETLRDSPTASA